MAKELSYIDYKCYIFDFDGVILNSNLVKENAIEIASQEYNQNLNYEDFLTFFKNNNGITREKKIRKFFAEEDSIIIENNYSSLLRDELPKCNLIDGIETYLELIIKKTTNLNVLSGGDRKEVLDILEKKNLKHFFCEVLGGPKEKEQNLKKIKTESKTIYFGDSKLDYEIALKNNFDFVFVHEKSRLKNWRNALDFSKNNCTAIKNIAEINNV